MISFIDKHLDQNNFKVWLYSPGGEFLGELLVDRPVLNLELEGLVSTFDFTIPENIEQALVIEENGAQTTDMQSIINPRLNETLDQFQVEVWYGDLTTDHFQKQRFIIIDNPNSFSNDITQFSYRAFSKEYENRFIRVIDWPGILIKELVSTFTFKNPNDFNTERIFTLTRTPRDPRLVRVELVQDFVQRLVAKIAKANTPYSFSSLQPKEETIKVFKYVAGSADILLVKDQDYEILVDDYTGLLSINYLIGSQLNENDPVYIEYRLSEPTTLSLIRSENANLLGEFDYFYNENNSTIKVRIPRIPQVFLPDTVQDYDTTIPTDSAILIKVYYEPITFSPGDEIKESLTKDGLTIKQVIDSLLLFGDEDNNNGKWSAFYSSILDDELRSGFNFNNTNLLNSIIQTLAAFNAIAIPDTLEKRFFIYEKTTPDTFTLNNQIVSSYRQQTNLSIEYGKYLRGVSQNISTEELVTVMRALGADNITASSATPTGFNEWEDYTYYLDGAFITNFNNLQSGNTSTIELNKTGRWMSKRLTEKLLLWIQAREGVERLLYEGPLPNFNITHELEKFGSVTLNPSTAFSNYTSENGLVLIQDRILEIIGSEQEKLVPLKIEEARQTTLLDILEDPTSVPHLANWTGSFLVPGSGSATPYSGISGYKDYITAKKTVLDAQLTAIENAIGVLERDFAFINKMLQAVYASIKKDVYAGLIRASGLEAYNFGAEDFEELKGFRREGVYENKFITKPSVLYQEMKKEIEAFLQPRIEMTADIIGLLQAVEARVEWNNVVLGGLANIIVPRLNIDRQIQIKSLSIAPDDFSTTITFSTEKNYIGVGQKFLGRFLSKASYNITNNLGFNDGKWLQAAEDGANSIDKFNFGFAIGDDNPLKTQTVIISDAGIGTDGHTINPLDDTPVSASSDIGRMILFGFVKINAGRIDVYDRNNTGQVVNSLVIKPSGVIHTAGGTITSMTSTGFQIAHNNASIFSVDQLGNAFFGGNVTVGYSDITGSKPPVDADNTGSAFTQGVVTAGRLEVPSAGVTGDGTAGSSVRLYAGSTFANRASASFRVTQDGSLVATNASITGSISSDTGFIGGWNITSSGLNFGTAMQLRSNGELRVAGSAFFTNILTSPKFLIDGNATGSQKIIDTLSGKFSVTADGILTATDGNFSGQVTINKPSFSSTNAGVFLGFDSGLAKLNIGDSTNFMKWNGTSLEYTGKVGVMNVETTDTKTLATGLSGILSFGDFVVQNRTGTGAGTGQIYMTNNANVVGGTQLNPSLTVDNYVNMSQFGINLNQIDLGQRKSVNIGFGGISMRDPSYIVSPAVGNTASVPAAHISGTTLTIFLP